MTFLTCCWDKMMKNFVGFPLEFSQVMPGGCTESSVCHRVTFSSIAATISGPRSHSVVSGYLF